VQVNSHGGCDVRADRAIESPFLHIANFIILSLNQMNASGELQSENKTSADPLAEFEASFSSDRVLVRSFFFRGSKLQVVSLIHA
jgi:hypothetical protein